MTIEEKIRILKDQLKRFKVTKQACDSCIPQELINSHEEIIKDLELLEKLKNQHMSYEKDKIGFNNLLKHIIAMQKDIRQPIYVVARFWLREFQGIEDIITCDGDKDLEELKQIFKDRYTSDCHTFMITETSYKILKINIMESME